MEKKIVKKRRSSKKSRSNESAESGKSAKKVGPKFPHLENFHRPIKTFQGEILQQMVVSTEIINDSKQVKTY